MEGSRSAAESSAAGRARGGRAADAAVGAESSATPADLSKMSETEQMEYVLAESMRTASSEWEPIPATHG